MLHKVPKLHETKFKYHLIASILKSQNSVAQMQDFSACKDIFWSIPRFVKVA